ncbi:hypothetical protein [Flavisolibacter nicotianae]|uniref:hypothetical protein n=1 Tax=Flavisolibacter nicotianae TaxID=2364882 RepID=UPI000EAC90DE|nr:hypothetical protein [Flavisolibacter nicotianae]
MHEDLKTYTAGRKCRHCGTPIADQAHGATEFCPRTVLVDGRVRSCRDDYHNAQRSEADQPYLQLVAYQKQTSRALAILKKAKGERVRVDDLNQYGIALYRAVETGLSAGRPFFSFLHHQVHQLDDDTFQIIDHVYTR